MGVRYKRLADSFWKEVRRVLDFGFYNMDCMDGMKEFPDGYFELAICDPPYGINVGQASMGAGGSCSTQKQEFSESAHREAATRPSFRSEARRSSNNRGGLQNNWRFETLREQSEWGGALHQSQNLQGI